jgi:hypothetical protein
MSAERHLWNVGVQRQLHTCISSRRSSCCFVRPPHYVKRGWIARVVENIFTHIEKGNTNNNYMVSVLESRVNILHVVDDCKYGELQRQEDGQQDGERGMRAAVLAEDAAATHE